MAGVALATIVQAAPASAKGPQERIASARTFLTAQKGYAKLPRTREVGGRVNLLVGGAGVSVGVMTRTGADGKDRYSLVLSPKLQLAFGVGAQLEVGRREGYQATPTVEHETTRTRGFLGVMQWNAGSSEPLPKTVRERAYAKAQAEIMAHDNPFYVVPRLAALGEAPRRTSTVSDTFSVSTPLAQLGTRDELRLNLRLPIPFFRGKNAQAERLQRVEALVARAERELAAGHAERAATTLDDADRVVGEFHAGQNTRGRFEALVTGY